MYNKIIKNYKSDVFFINHKMYQPSTHVYKKELWKQNQHFLAEKRQVPESEDVILYTVKTT